MSETQVAVLLVAGVGERLRPLTNDRPKALIDVGGESMLARATRLLVESGVNELILATGYLEEAVRAAMASCPVNVTYCRNDAYDRTQNSVSLSLCRQAIRGRSFYKLDGDVLFDKRVLKRLASAPEGISTAIERRNDMGAEEMKVHVEVGSKKILSFGKHLDPARSYGESIGIERVSGPAVERLFDRLDELISGGKTNLYYEDVYSQLIAEGVPSWMVEITDLKWAEVDTPEDLDIAKALVKSGALEGG
ncbi:MAG: phosphocholine cytidylyltransferase family protein [Polyangiaceae bacterium]